MRVFDLFQGDRDYIGFATLPEQVHRKSVKRGFDFTLMVVGESGLGKSTLINSLFLSDLYKDRKIPEVNGKPNVFIAYYLSFVHYVRRGEEWNLTKVKLIDWYDVVKLLEHLM